MGNYEEDDGLLVDILQGGVLLIYYVVSRTNHQVKKCIDKEELISYIALYNLRSGNEKRNLLLDNIAMNKNDMKLKYDFYCNNNILVPREYIVYDEYGRIIDPRYYSIEILNFNAGRSKENRNCATYSDVRFNCFENNVKPAAHGGNKFRHFFRYAKTMNEKRQNAIPEYKLYIRGRRKVSHISPAFDDYYVHTEKNWKRFKIPKQYMKRVIGYNKPG